MIYFILPVYNEAANLPELLSSLAHWARTRQEECRLIAVDDGSTDASGELLASFAGLPLTLVQHRPNLGVARVFDSGFRAWSALPYRTQDLVATLEADNTSSLEILDAMVRQARAGYDLVLASCYAEGGEVAGTNLLRKTLSFCANLILRCTPGMPQVQTFSSFYRVYRAPLLRRGLAAYGTRLIEETGYVCVVEILLKLGLLKARICEVPLRLDGSRRKGPSKMKVLHTIRGYLKLFVHAATGTLARPGTEEHSAGPAEASARTESKSAVACGSPR
jgi:dolichol-phosphate mannosyltransferase